MSNGRQSVLNRSRRPEIKDKHKQNNKEYYSRPEVKKRRNELNRARRKYIKEHTMDKYKNIFKVEVTDSINVSPQ